MVAVTYPTPAYLFDPHSPEIIAQSLKNLQEEAFAARTKELEEYEDWYTGGANVQKYLYRNPAETDESFFARQRRICHLNYIGRIVDEVVDDVYGDEVQRSFGPTADPKAEEALKLVLNSNNSIAMQQETCRSQVLLGDGWINVNWREADQMVGLHTVHPLDIWYRMDSANPGRMLELVERRVSQRRDIPRATDGSLFTYWIWNEKEFCEVDMHGRILTPAQVNRYGTIPYARWRGRTVVGTDDGLSFVRDAITIQRLVLNRVSDLDKLIRYQTHGLLVIKGIDDPKIAAGADAFLRLVNEGDQAYFISPNANIQAVVESVKELVDAEFVISSVPSSLIRGGQANSGLQLAIEMRPLTRVVGTVRTLAKPGEMRMISLIAIVGRAHGQMIFPEKPDPVAEFSDNFLPADEDAAFTRDLAMLNNYPEPLMTREDFLSRWHTKLRNNPTALKNYMLALDKEKEKANLTPTKSAATEAIPGQGSAATSGVVPPSGPPNPPGQPGGKGKEFTVPGGNG